MEIVAHFIRRFLPYSATFIRNQILFQRNFKPVIIFRENVENGLSRNDLPCDLQQLDLSHNQAIVEGLAYKWLRMITSQQVNVVNYFLTTNKVNILHFHFGTDAGMYSNIMQKAGIPSVVSFYGYDCSSFPNRYWGYGRRYLVKNVFPYATAILAMSDDMKKDLIKLGCPERKIVVHYYGTETDRFFFPGRKYELKEKVTFLTVGRLDEKKGFSFMIEAFNKIAKEGNTNFVWHIVGSGKLEEHLKNKIADYGLKSQVNLIGPLPYNSGELLEQYQNAEIYIQPNITGKSGDKEGISGSIVEAMASGLPVISSHHAGIPEIMSDGNTGLLVKEWDIDTLITKIKCLSQDVTLRKKTGINARNYAMANLNITSKMNEREQIYASIISGKQFN